MSHHPSGRIVRACNNCRERKTRCDGKTPTCTTCSTSIRTLARPCQYDNVRTEAQALEKDIRRLEARLRELEGQRDADDVRLTAPYSNATEYQYTLHALESNTLSPDASQLLIDAFVARGQSYGFFLDVSAFQEGLLGDSSPVKSSGLLSVVHLLGFHFSRLPSTPSEPDTTEKLLISRVVSETAQNRAHVIHSIQAEVLLCTYFFSLGRILEGQYHLNTATSIAVGAGLHKLRVSSSPDEKENEKIQAFWMVYTLINCWDVALQSSLSGLFGAEGENIETLWPGQITPVEGSVVRRFLHGIDVVRSSSEPALATYAKASVLFRISSTIAERYAKGHEIPPEEAARISSTFASHRRLLDSFQSSLPQLSPTTDPIFGIVLFILALSQASIIHLNAPLFGKDATCTEASIQAARKCVKLLTSPDVEAYFRQPGAGARINPLWGYILKTVSDILKVNNEDSEMLEKSIELLSICSGGSGLIRYNWELAA